MKKGIGFKSILSLALVASVLAGCGGNPAGKVVDRGGKLKDLNLNQPQPGANTPQQDPNRVIQLMQLVGQAHTRNNSVACDLVAFFRKDNGSTTSMKTKYRFQKPKQTSMEILEATDGGTVGTKLVWNGGSDVAVKTKLLGFWLKTSLSVTDDRIKDSRGYRINETSLDQLYATLLHPQAKHELLSEGVLKGRPVAIVRLDSPMKLRGVTHEVFGIFVDTFTPAFRELYGGETLLMRLQIENARLNPQMEANAFNLD
ncbi:hypothetical protein D3C87_923330 [compost metagenome]